MISLPRVNYIDEEATRDIEVLLREGFKTADPTLAVKRVVKLIDDVVVVDSLKFKPRRIHVVGFGKASLKMLMGLLEALDNRVEGGIVITPEFQGRIGPVEVLRGDHPYPGENTLTASKKLLEYLSNNVSIEDLVFVLISGGGSALFEIPEKELTLGDIAEVTKKLMLAGADIYELNTVRKHLSRVKGGKFARYIRGDIVALIVSDVVGDDLGTIASGPLAPDPTSFQDVYRILVKRGVWNQLSSRIREFIEKGLKGLVEETIKPGDPLLNKVHSFIVASNTESLLAMENKAREMGYNTLLLTPYLTGEAREVAGFLASIIKSIARINKPIHKPAVLIAGGETTVTVHGRGVGGRNQELCLALTIEIRDVEGVIATCIASDGIDGNSPAAGALTGSSVYRVAVESGLKPEEYLDENNSYSFFDKMKLSIKTGYTGTNVNDFFIAIIK